VSFKQQKVSKLNLLRSEKLIYDKWLVKTNKWDHPGKGIESRQESSPLTVGPSGILQVPW
jgi:hypothetical protein